MNRLDILEQDIDYILATITDIIPLKEKNGRRNIKYLEISENLFIEVAYCEIMTNIIEVTSECYDKEGKVFVEYNLISDNNSIHKKRFTKFISEIKKLSFA